MTQQFTAPNDRQGAKFMSEFSQRLLNDLNPNAAKKNDDSHQKRKSTETRILILEATIDCLVENGYAALSIREIITKANISRGAMHYHFASKAILVEAVTEYTFFKRMEKFLADYTKPHNRGDDFIHVATDLHWQNVQSREYAAFLELAVAARTNQTLNQAFQPIAQRYDKVWREEMHKAFPEWQLVYEKLQQANDFAIVVHMGMLLNIPIMGNGERMKKVQDIVHMVIQQLYEAPKK